MPYALLLMLGLGELILFGALSMKRNLPKNIYYDKTNGYYIAQVGRWYFNIKLGRYATVQEAENALEQFRSTYGELLPGPEGSFHHAFKRIFGDKQTTITADRFKQWREIMLLIADVELNNGPARSL